MSASGPEVTMERQVYLRVKRKREDEPATHMVAEVAIPGTKKPRGLFTYKGTEEDSDMFDSPDYVPKWSATPPNDIPISGSSTSPGPDSQAPPPSADPLARSTRTSSPLKTSTKSYTIIPRTIASLPYSRRPTAPPVVRSASKPQQQVPTITFYDAVEAEETLEEKANPEMEAFTAMVNDYLQLHDISITTEEDPKAASQNDDSAELELKPSPESTSYVYDIFQLSVKDVKEVQELLAAGDISTVTGLPYWELMTDSLADDGSDDSVKDEADEDSNDEDFYKNDYPDDEVSDDEESAWRTYRYDSD